MSYQLKNALTDPGEIDITVLLIMLEMLVLCVQVYILHITKLPFKSLKHIRICHKCIYSYVHNMFLLIHILCYM